MFFTSLHLIVTVSGIPITFFQFSLFFPSSHSYYFISLVFFDLVLDTVFGNLSVGIIWGLGYCFPLVRHRGRLTFRIPQFHLSSNFLSHLNRLKSVRGLICFQFTFTSEWRHLVSQFKEADISSSLAVSLLV